MANSRSDMCWVRNLCISPVPIMSCENIPQDTAAVHRNFYYNSDTNRRVEKSPFSHPASTLAQRPNVGRPFRLSRQTNLKISSHDHCHAIYQGGRLLRAPFSLRRCSPTPPADATATTV